MYPFWVLTNCHSSVKHLQRTIYLEKVSFFLLQTMGQWITCSSSVANPMLNDLCWEEMWLLPSQGKYCPDIGIKRSLYHHGQFKYLLPIQFLFRAMIHLIIPTSLITWGLSIHPLLKDRPLNQHPQHSSHQIPINIQGISMSVLRLKQQNQIVSGKPSSNPGPFPDIIPNLKERHPINRESPKPPEPGQACLRGSQRTAMIRALPSTLCSMTTKPVPGKGG